LEKNKPIKKTVCSEAFGLFNKKDVDFRPKNKSKSSEAVVIIANGLDKSFLFKQLNEDVKSSIIKVMEEQVLQIDDKISDNKL